MTTHFDELMAQKSDEELKEYIINIDRYTPEALISVVNELKKRGQNFSDDELKFINERIHEKIESEDEENSMFVTPKSWKKNVVTDSCAPLLYSKIAIWMFSVVFTVVFGAILLSLNIESRTNKLKVLGFGVLFTTLAAIIGRFPQTLIYVISINIIGGYILTSDFWNRYIGKETKYRTKSIWIPIIISIILTIGVIAIANKGYN